MTEGAERNFVFSMPFSLLSPLSLFRPNSQYSSLYGTKESLEW